MAHENGRIFIDTTTTPHNGVEIADLQQVLGRGTGDLGLLCSDQEWYLDHIDPVTLEPVYLTRPVNRINKWAKYKPVKQSGLDFGSQRNSDFTWKSTAVWWKAYNGQCGLSFTTFSQLYVSNDPFNVNSFLRKLIDGDLPWAYEPPTGGINQYPFRMFDFLQYDHLAPKPVAGVNDIIRLSDGGKLTVQFDMTRAGESLGIQLSDIAINNSQLGNFYLGVLIYLSASTGYYMFAFSEDTIGNGADSVEFTGMTAYSGQRPMIVPFLASARAAQGTSPGSGIFLSCDVEPQEIQIRPEPSTTLTIDAQWKYGYGGLVSYDIRILNDTGAQIPVNNMEVGLYDGIPNQGGVRIDYDTIDDFVVAIDGFKDVKGTVDSSGNYDPSKTYYVRVTSSNPSVNGYVQVEAPRNPLIQ